MKLTNIITYLILTTVSSLFYSSSALAQKTDTVYLYNGDRITGELKKFETGLLYLSTDAMQTVTIEYDRILTVWSEKNFEFRTAFGRRYFGTIRKSETPGAVIIITNVDSIRTPLSDIVQITSIKNSFFQSIDGSIDLGLNYTKASDVLQYSIQASVIHRTTNYYNRFDLRSIISDEANNISRNNDAGISVTRLFTGQWYVSAQIKGQQNTELNLDFRVLSGVGGGYDVIRTNSQRLNTLAGVIANRERTIDSLVVSNNLELVVGVHYKLFRYRHPKIDISSGFDVFPNLTTKGRVRIESDLNAKLEILKDLFFGVTLYYNYDNNPSSNSSSKSDWGVITSIGYSF